MQPVLVLGIGNILLQDEGVGVRVIERMQGMEMPPFVEVVDGGTSGTDLVEVLADRPKVIVIDALDWDEKPGTVFRLSADELAPDEGESISLHQLGLVDTLRITRLLGCEPKEVIVFGIQPRSLRPGLELTPEVAAVVPRVIQAVMAEVQASECRAAATPGEDCPIHHDR
jgi:hydrogenase maturation protease